MAVAGLFRRTHGVLPGGQARKGVGKIGIVGRKGLNRGVEICLRGEDVLHLLHTRHFRRLNFHTTGTGTACRDSSDLQIKRTNVNYPREVKVIRVPVRSRCGGGTCRLGFYFHFVVAFLQIEERHPLIRTRAALAGQHRCAVPLVELEGGFRESRRTIQPHGDTTTRPRTATGRCARTL